MAWSLARMLSGSDCPADFEELSWPRPDQLLRGIRRN